MRVDLIQNAFTTGEVSPRLMGRTDLKKFPHGLARLENYIIHPHGGVSRRGGFKFVQEVKDSTKTTILYSFNYKDEFSYVLEFGHNYMRVFRNQAYVAGSEIVTTYTQTEVEDLRFVQDDTTIYIAHKDHAPAKLTRSAHDTWVLANLVFTATPAAWGASNYPSLVWFYEQRLFWGATPSEPNRIWGSQSADYLNHTLGTGLDNEAIDITVKEATKIRWASSGSTCLLGAYNGEFKLGAASLNEVLTPTNMRPVRYTGLGSAFIAPIRIDSDVLFVQRGGRKLRRLQYRWQSETYKAEDLSIMSEHISESGITDIAYLNEPDSLFWAVRTDGKLIGMTYEPDHEVYGWHKHIIGGTDTVLKSIAVIDGATNEAKDELWAIVSRTIDGSTVQYIEFKEQGLGPEDDQEDSFFVDSGITTTGSDLDEVTAAHLVGETVSILADGAVQPNQTVGVGGAVSIDPVADKVHVGLPYTSLMETLPFEGGNPIGSSLGQIKRISKIHARIYRTLGLNCGIADGTLDAYEFGPTSSMNDMIPVFTGDIELSFAGGFDKQSRVHITQEDPLPQTILALVYEVSVK